MNESIKRALLSVVIGGVFQVFVGGCSSQSPMGPLANENIVATIIESHPGVLTSDNANTGAQQHQGNQDARYATDFDVRNQRDDAENVIEFTGLIVGFDVETQIINLMEMQGNFKTWVGHVTENSELIGLEGETVQLANFGVCFQALARGEQINENEFTINFLQMKNF